MPGVDGVVRVWDICNGGRGNGRIRKPNLTFYSNSEAVITSGHKLYSSSKEEALLEPGETYYLKFLVRVDYPDDNSKTGYAGRVEQFPGAYGYLEDWWGETHGFGYDALPGVWQSVVIPVVHGEMADIYEIFFFNVYRGLGNYTKVFFGQYMVLADSDEPLDIPYPDGEDWPRKWLPINMAFVVQILEQAAGRRQIVVIWLTDFNGDGVTDAADVLWMLKAAVGM